MGFIDVRYRFVRSRHKASGAALGLSCAACFEQPAGVFAGCGAKYNPRVIASGTAMSLMGESSKSHLKVFSGLSSLCRCLASAKQLQRLISVDADLLAAII